VKEELKKKEGERRKRGTIKRWVAARQPRGVKPPQLDIVGLTRILPAAPCGWHSFHKSELKKNLKDESTKKLKDESTNKTERS
jgi:hypothetical protein